MKTKSFIIIIALAFSTIYSFAQKKYTPGSMDQLIAFSWEITVPAGNDNLITKTGLAGGRFEYRKFVNPNFSAGIAVSFNGVEQLFDRKTYEKPDGSLAVTTDMVRQSFTMPITLIGHYYPTITNHMVKPYFGLGLGTQYASQNIFYNIYVIDHSDWGFFAKPEIGTLIMFNHNSSGLVSVGYNYSTNKIDDLGINKFTSLTFNLGIALTLE